MVLLQLPFSCKQTGGISEVFDVMDEKLPAVSVDDRQRFLLARIGAFDDGQLADALRKPGRNFQCYQSAVAVTRQMRPFDTERVHEVAEVVGHGSEVVAGLHFFAHAVALHIEQHHAVMLREHGRDIEIVHGQVAEHPVDHDNRFLTFGIQFLYVQTDVRQVDYWHS